MTVKRMLAALVALVALPTIWSVYSASASTLELDGGRLEYWKFEVQLTDISP
jgi:hypothetical protein